MAACVQVALPLRATASAPRRAGVLDRPRDRDGADVRISVALLLSSPPQATPHRSCCAKCACSLCWIFSWGGALDLGSHDPPPVGSRHARRHARLHIPGGRDERRWGSSEGTGNTVTSARTGPVITSSSTTFGTSGPPPFTSGPTSATSPPSTSTASTSLQTARFESRAHTKKPTSNSVEVGFVVSRFVALAAWCERQQTRCELRNTALEGDPSLEAEVLLRALEVGAGVQSVGGMRGGANNSRVPADDRFDTPDNVAQGDGVPGSEVARQGRVCGAPECCDEARDHVRDVGVVPA